MTNVCEVLWELFFSRVNKSRIWKAWVLGTYWRNTAMETRCLHEKMFIAQSNLLKDEMGCQQNSWPHDTNVAKWLRVRTIANVTFNEIWIILFQKYRRIRTLERQGTNHDRTQCGKTCTSRKRALSERIKQNQDENIYSKRNSNKEAFAIKAVSG
jgi:hypothetical protein